ncbi:MAG: type II toxin-antitoxin system RelE/ParE family toxin [Propionibacteriaceae bacterium]|nr:type II toxin-antitoxin system RelE/ParE family toxin [Propionibacteriaceae bacterium]
MDVTWRLSFHADTWDDANEALQYYSEIDSGLTTAFLDELSAAFIFLRQYPEGATILRTPYRRVAMRRFPYLVCYRVIRDSSTVRILAIAHTQRDPRWLRTLLAKRAQ